jgi:putative ABC transport system ATP-binding protein
MSYAVECEQIEKSFGSSENLVKVLRGVNLEVPFGEMTFLVGPSGCGKTTLLSIIAGLLRPSSGGLRVLGEPLAQLPGTKSVEFRRQNLGFVFQQFNLLPALTAAENAAVPLFAAGVKRKAAVDRAVALLGAC